MSVPELFILAVGLSMDAFAVSVCKGLSMQKMRMKNALTVGIYFGGFQALMPAIWELISKIPLQPMIIGSHLYCWVLSEAT